MSEDRLSHLLSVGMPATDPLLEPEIAVDGRPVMEQDEAPLYTGQHVVVLSLYNTSAGLLRNKQEWETLEQLDKPADVLFTTSRVVYSWPKWKSDRSAGSFFERRVLSVITEHNDATLLLGGHLRHQWIKTVIIAKPAGRLKKESKIRLTVQDGETDFAVTVLGFTHDTARAVGQRFVAAVAARRLEEYRDVKEPTAAALRALTAGHAPTQELAWGSMYKLPAAMKVGYGFKRT
jgi:hypothetical protein